MKKQNYLCVDLTTEMLDQDIQENENRKGVLTMTEADEHFTFKESQPCVHVEHPELHWRLVDRTKHGKMTVNSRHVKVEFYLKHDEYEDGRELADVLASEIETLGENLCEKDLKEEVAKCLC